MGMFDNIIFDEFTLLEYTTKDEYSISKINNLIKKKSDDNKEFLRASYRNAENIKKDSKKYKEAAKKVLDHNDKTGRSNDGGYNVGTRIYNDVDAVLRHERRHSK